MDETMNAHMLFPQIGKVIASTGSRHFPRMLHDLIQTQLMVDATHIRHVRVEPHSASANDATLLSETVFSEPDLPCTGLDTPARPPAPTPTGAPAHNGSPPPLTP